MFWFNSKNDENLTKLLKDGKVDFSFNKDGVKNRLFYSINHSTLPRNANLGIPRFKLGYSVTVVSALLLALSTTFVYADSSNPGDSLYFLDQFHEKVILLIPRSDASRAQLNSNLVEERIWELNQLPHDEMNYYHRIKAMQATQMKLIESVDQASAVKVRFKSEGKQTRVERMNEVLIQLERLAEEQEQEIERSKDRIHTEDEILLQQHLEEIKKARLKARTQRELNLNEFEVNLGL